MENPDFNALSRQLPKQVNIVEVGPRDGLQNETRQITLEVKLHLIAGLVNAGLKKIEAGSFVNPKAVPQMADSDQLFLALPPHDSVTYTALTPNIRGFDRALDCGVKEVAVFAAATDSFSQKNINCSIAESFSRFSPVIKKAQLHKIPVRGYISCVAGCPYEGAVNPRAVSHISQQLLDAGCYEISLGDTIGVATAKQVGELLSELGKTIPTNYLAMHLHDTYGQALANTYAALQMGIDTFDSAVAGLGGCPFAKGATGNVATEDLVYFLDGLNIQHGVDIEALARAGQKISDQLKRPNSSNAGRALIARGILN